MTQPDVPDFNTPSDSAIVGRARRIRAVGSEIDQIARWLTVLLVIFVMAFLIGVLAW